MVGRNNAWNNLYLLILHNILKQSIEYVEHYINYYMIFWRKILNFFLGTGSLYFGNKKKQSNLLRIPRILVTFWSAPNHPFTLKYFRLKFMKEIVSILIEILLSLLHFYLFNIRPEFVSLWISVFLQFLKEIRKLRLVFNVRRTVIYFYFKWHVNLYWIIWPKTYKLNLYN